MSISFPDPDDFGEPGIKPAEKIDPDDYQSLFDYEEDDEE